MQYDIFEIAEIAGDINKSIAYLQERGVLMSEHVCDCGKNMKMVADDSKIDGCVYKCEKDGITRSIRSGSIFLESKLSLKKLIMLVYFWVDEASTSNITKWLRMDSHAMNDWASVVKDACGEALSSLGSDLMIGGHEVVVEIDEFLVTRRNKHYHRGRMHAELWLFGGVEKNTNKWFAQVITKRDRKTLINVISRFIRPGTIIYSNQGTGYWTERFRLTTGTSEEGYYDLEINNSVYYVQPVSTLYTSTLEVILAGIKSDLKKKTTMSAETKVSYMDFKLWLSRNKQAENILDSFWNTVSVYA